MIYSFFSRLLTSFVIILTLVSCSSDSKKDKKETAAEKKAVEQARFVDLEGNEVTIDRFKGKVVLIDFWETWCKPCLNSFPTMQKLMEDYPNSFVVLAVTPGFADSKEDAREFAENHDYDFVYLYDENKLHEALDVQGIPFKVFIDDEGEFVEASMGSMGPEGDYSHAKNIIEKHVKS